MGKLTNEEAKRIVEAFDVAGARPKLVEALGDYFRTRHAARHIGDECPECQNYTLVCRTCAHETGKEPPEAPPLLNPVAEPEPEDVEGTGISLR